MAINLVSLDTAYLGRASVLVEAKSLNSRFLDIAYLGTPFFGYSVSSDVVTDLTGQSFSATPTTLYATVFTALQGTYTAVFIDVLTPTPSKLLDSAWVSSSSSYLTTPEATVGLSGQIVGLLSGILTALSIDPTVTLSLSGQTVGLLANLLTPAQLKTLDGVDVATIIGLVTAMTSVTPSGQSFNSAGQNPIVTRTTAVNGIATSLGIQSLIPSPQPTLLGQTVATSTALLDLQRLVGLAGLAIPTLSGVLASLKLVEWVIYEHKPCVLIASNTGSLDTIAVEWLIYEPKSRTILAASRSLKVLVEAKPNILVVPQD